MQDLNTINRLNAEAFAASIQNYRRQGRWVLAKYAGLHLESIETFLVQSDAQAAFDAEASKRDASGRAVLFTPFPVSEPTPVRDQSEDRLQRYTPEQLAALGRSKAKPDVTLSDYINRKTI